MRRFVLLLLLAVIVAAGGAFLYARYEYSAAGPKAAMGTETIVLIPAGSGVSGIAQALKDADVVSSAGIFQWEVRVRGVAKKLKAGEYAIPSEASMQDIAGILIAGKSVEHKLTVAEGLTSQMAYNLVLADPVLLGDAAEMPKEGTLLPDTYLFIRGTTRNQLLTRMETAQDKLLAQLWAKRAANLPFKTKEAAIILASIVEKETALPAERRHIAAVFENRLRRGMKLQSDPTIVYGLTGGVPLGHGIRVSEIGSTTSYNTYVIEGLPPGPICNPGRDAIAAVLNPMPSNDLYFVADGSGGHVFAATLADHEKNVAHWRQLERQGGH